MNGIEPLLTELSYARMSCPVGIWSNSPDLSGWLLANGKAFDFDPFKLDRKKSRPVHCYLDAQEQALKSKDMTYCEGYAQLGIEIPCPHAWCVNKKGRVVDPAWRKFPTPERYYFGVPFKRSFVREFTRRRGTECSILLWREENWPIQNGAIPPEEWREAK